LGACGSHLLAAAHAALHVTRLCGNATIPLPLYITAVLAAAMPVGGRATTAASLPFAAEC
jgi:hypothetical protein